MRRVLFWDGAAVLCFFAGIKIESYWLMALGLGLLSLALVDKARD